MYDPFEDPLDALQRMYQQNTQQPPPAARPVVPRLAPEEEQGVFSKIADTAMTGLGYVGDTLDKTFGGRAVRGVLGGHYREALSVLPGSDTLGLTDMKDRVSGQDLLKTAGLLDGDGTKGEFELRDLAGPAAEMLLDPGSYLSFGAKALTKAGLDAAKQGKLASTYAGRIAGGQANLVGLGLPFGLGGPSTVGVGTGAVAQKVAGLADKGADFAAYGNPVGRYSSALFDNRVKGQTDAVTQRVLRQMAPEERALVARNLGPVYDAATALRDGGDLGNSDGLRAAVEGVAQQVPDHVARAAAAVDRATQAVADRLTASGVPLAQFDEQMALTGQRLGYAPRGRTLPAVEAAGATGGDGRTFSTALGNQQGRDDLYRNFVQGTGGVNALWKDAAVTGEAAPLTGRVNDLVGQLTDARDTYRQAMQGPMQPSWLTDQYRQILGHDPASAAERQQLLSQLGDARTEALRTGTHLTDHMPAQDLVRLEQLSHPFDYGAELAGRARQFNGPDDVFARQLGGQVRGELGGRQIGESYLPLDAERRAELFANRGLAPNLDRHQTGLERELQAVQGGATTWMGRPVKTAAELQAGIDRLAEFAHPETGLAARIAEGAGLETQAQQLARRVAGVTPEESRLGLFGNHVLADLTDEAKAAARSEHNANAVTRIVSAKAVQGLHNFTADTVPIQSALRELGLTGVDPATGRLIAEKNVLGRLGNPTDFNGLPLQGNRVGIARSDLEALKGMNDRVKVPEAASGILGAIDSVRSLFKAHVTAPFPNFTGRNFAGGVFNNVKEDAFSTRSFQDARKIYAGEKVIDGAADRYFPGKGLSDEDATNQLGRRLFTQDVFHGGLTQANDVAKAAAGGGLQPLNFPGLTEQPSLAEIAKGYIPKSGAEANPLNVAGFGGTAGFAKRNADQFAPVVAGRKANEMVEQVNRGTAFLEKLSQGYAPEVAAGVSDRAHFNYGNRTNFERDVMQRLVPFYTFQSRNALRTAQDLAGNPAGVVGRLTALNADARHNNDTFVPPYLGSGVAVPVGSGQAGQQRFLTQLGLPFESAFDALKPSGLKESLMGAASQLDPLLKGPLELMAGKQFYSGRDLNVNDLYGPTGSTTAEQVLSNSPLARYYTTAKQLADPRKGLLDNAVGLTTGLKLSDVDVDKQKDQLVRNLLEDRFKNTPGIGSVEQFYLKPDQAAKLQPQDLELYKVYQDLLRRQQERGKALAAGRQPK